MQKIDMEYLANAIARLSGVPVRVYRDGVELLRCFPAHLPQDPLSACREEVLAIPAHVGYYVTPCFHCYGVLQTEDTKLVIGPTAQIMADEQKLRELAFQIDIPPAEVPAFLDGMHSIRCIPLETLLQMLCTLNHLLNDGEKLALSDLAIHAAAQTALKTAAERQRTASVYDEAVQPRQTHNTLAIEDALMGIVSSGDSVALRRWLAAAPAVQAGAIAGDQLRQMRNLFIVTATLVSRAAIRGGMREDDAFSLSDAYIQRVELLTGHDSILDLQVNMLLEFTEQVEKLRRSAHTTRLSLDVANYVRHHLSEPVSVEKMAAAFYMSRPYLSARFKKETGQTLTDFILNEKTQEAKRLLRYSDKPQSAICAYLGFSSQGHFARVFRKYAGMTPGEFREDAGW